MDSLGWETDAQALILIGLLCSIAMQNNVKKRGHYRMSRSLNNPSTKKNLPSKNVFNKLEIGIFVFERGDIYSIISHEINKNFISKLRLSNLESRKYHSKISTSFKEGLLPRYIFY